MGMALASLHEDWRFVRVGGEVHRGSAIVTPAQQR
jgi:hypothetical protein